MKPLRIVHCANFSILKNGAVFYAMDRKISYGLIQNGHFVYDFSYRDQAKTQRFLNFKQKSIKKMNNDLVETCANIQPNLLLLGKSEILFPETLKKIKNIVPNIKIAKWFVDIVENEKNIFFEHFKYLDSFFYTSATKLKELSSTYPNTTFSYIPNITEPSIDKKIVCDKEYDIIYIARDHKEDVRYKFAVLLKDFCIKNNINLKLYGSLGNPTIFGQQYFNAIAKAKIAINFNRTDLLDQNGNEILGTSDRMSHFLGIGVCVFSPKIKGLELLYKDEEDVVYFQNIKELYNKIKFYLKDKNYEKIALNGNKKAYEISNAKRITNYMLEIIYQQVLTQNYEWSNFKFKNGLKI